MAGRGRTSFQKRQKEQLRLERRQQKAAKKEARKAAKIESPGGLVEAFDQGLESDQDDQETDREEQAGQGDRALPE